MAILRKRQRAQYTVIDNTIFRDKTLSNKALGMLCRMLSLPDGWEFSVMGLAELSTDGKSAVMSQLDELEEHGYLTRNRVRENGKMAGVEYIVSETRMSEKPYADFPHTEKPHTENPTQSITNISNNNKSNNKEYISEFDKLWEIYPRKQGKKKALEYYIKARKDGTTYEEVEEGIYAYARLCRAEQREERYIKHASTFFSQRAWLDDFTVSVKPKASGNPFADMLKEGMFND